MTPPATTSPVSLSGLVNGTTYSVQLRAVNAAGGGTAVAVADIRRTAPAQAPNPAGQAAGPVIILADGLSMQAADDPAVVTEDTAPASLVVSARDLGELIDILGPGSRVLIRQ